MEERRFQSGDAVIEEGGPGDFFYVTGSGELEVRVAPKIISFHGPTTFEAKCTEVLWPSRQLATVLPPLATA